MDQTCVRKNTLLLYYHFSPNTFTLQRLPMTFFMGKHNIVNAFMEEKKGKVEGKFSTRDSALLGCVQGSSRLTILRAK